MTITDVLFSCIGFFLVFNFKEIANNSKKMSESIESLNSKISILLERTEAHKQEIDRLRDGQENIKEEIVFLKAK